MQTNLKVANFLDVMLCLATGRHYPYWKPNDQPLYIHCLSNHAPNIIQNLPASISRSLTDISSDKAAFAEASPLYDDALRESGYSEKTQYLEHRKAEGR